MLKAVGFLLLSHVSTLAAQADESDARLVRNARSSGGLGGLQPEATTFVELTSAGVAKPAAGDDPLRTRFCANRLYKEFNPDCCSDGRSQQACLLTAESFCVEDVQLCATRRFCPSKEYTEFIPQGCKDSATTKSCQTSPSKGYTADLEMCEKLTPEAGAAKDGQPPEAMPPMKNAERTAKMLSSQGPHPSFETHEQVEQKAKEQQQAAWKAAHAQAGHTQMITTAVIVPILLLVGALSWYYTRRIQNQAAAKAGGGEEEEEGATEEQQGKEPLIDGVEAEGGSADE